MNVFGVQFSGAQAATVGSLLIASAALWRNAWASSVQARSVDTTNTLEILRRLSESTRLWRDSAPEHTLFEFREFINFLEALATLYNNRTFRQSAGHMVENLLIETIGVIDADPTMTEAYERSITTDATFRGIRQFRDRFGAAIERHRDFVAEEYLNRAGNRQSGVGSDA